MCPDLEASVGDVFAEDQTILHQEEKLCRQLQGNICVLLVAHDNSMLLIVHTLFAMLSLAYCPHEVAAQQNTAPL